MCRTNAAALWNALIRTHHITSRRKVGKLKQAAINDEVFVLLKSGSPPGIMYVEGSKDGVERWVSTVQRLRYKDYQLAARPAVISRESQVEADNVPSSGLSETESVKVFGQQMESIGVLNWWREAMGYSG